MITKQGPLFIQLRKQQPGLFQARRLQEPVIRAIRGHLLRLAFLQLSSWRDPVKPATTTIEQLEWVHQVTLRRSRIQALGCLHGVRLRAIRNNRLVLGHQALRLPLPGILPIAPGGEHQEVAGHQSCCHDHCGNLLELLDLHPCIVPRSPSRGVPCIVEGLGFSSLCSSRQRAAPSITVITPSP